MLGYNVRRTCTSFTSAVTRNNTVDPVDYFPYKLQAHPSVLVTQTGRRRLRCFRKMFPFIFRCVSASLVRVQSVYTPSYTSYCISSSNASPSQRILAYARPGANRTTRFIDTKIIDFTRTQLFRSRPELVP